MPNKFDYPNERVRSANALPEADTHMHSLVSWRSVLAGLLVTFLSMVILLSLGMAFGGIGLSDGSGLRSAGIFTGVWFLISSLISLFAGSYFTARISKFHTTRIGSAQGLVIASLFFGFVVWQTAQAIGWAGNAATNAASGAASAVGSGANALSANQTANLLVEDALSDLNLRSDPSVVVTGVASRLLRGNPDSAKNYLARMAGLTPAEADARIATLRAQVEAAAVDARVATAQAMQATGWSLFATLLLGSAAAIGGGALGSRANLRKPLVREQVDTVGTYGAIGV